MFVFLFLQDLGTSAGSKRPTCVIMVKPHDDYKEAYDECLEEVTSLPKPIWGHLNILFLMIKSN